MNLPAHLLHRLRRLMRRRYPPMIPGPSLQFFAAAAGRNGGEPPHRPKNMKLLFFVILGAVLIGLASLCSSCSTTTTRTVDPVTGQVIETTTQSADAAAVAFGSQALDTYATARARRVREEKSMSSHEAAENALAESNPLDTPGPADRTEWHSRAWGTFGPGGGSVPYRPELYPPATW